ncbi:MAG: 30S ribosomal protein S17 [Candidatus Moranbacteria bacterium]|nr:30S ribosomal protein S17 [Candidatus Moranbacteria bacterium]
MNTQATAQKVKKAPKMSGVVVSNKMVKTIVVAVDTLKTHPKYLKQYRSTKKYKVHTEGNHAIGEKVVFQECRPISKDKRHKIVTEE